MIDLTRALCGGIVLHNKKAVMQRTIYAPHSLMNEETASQRLFPSFTPDYKCNEYDVRYSLDTETLQRYHLIRERISMTLTIMVDTIAERIKRVYAAGDYSMAQLAKKLDIPKATLQNYIDDVAKDVRRGTEMIVKDKLRMIEKELNIDN